MGLVHPEIVLHLVSDLNYQRFFGVMECTCLCLQRLFVCLFVSAFSSHVFLPATDDPALKAPPKHREFLAKSVFRQEIPIEDEALRQRIQQNYRLQYLEHILPRVLDDPTINMLHKMIMMNNQTIVTQLLQSESYKDNLCVPSSYQCTAFSLFIRLFGRLIQFV